MSIFEARYGSTTSVFIEGGKDPVFTWAGNRDVYTYRLRGYVQFNGGVTPTGCVDEAFNPGCTDGCAGSIAPGMKFIADRATTIRWDLVLYRGDTRVATYFLSQFAMDTVDGDASCCGGGGANEPNFINKHMTGKYRYYLFLHPLAPKLACYIEFNSVTSQIGNTTSKAVNGRIVYNKTTIDSKAWPSLSIDEGATYGSAGPSWNNAGLDSTAAAKIQAVGAFAWATPTAYTFNTPTAMDAHWGTIAPQVEPIPFYSGGLSGFLLSGYAGTYQQYNAKNLSVLKYGAVHPHKVNKTCPYMFAFRKIEFNKLQDNIFNWQNRMSMIVDANYNYSYYQNPADQKLNAFRIGAFNEWQYHWESNVMDLDSLRTLCEKGPSDSPLTMGVL